jgi:hypothetical protein
MPKNKIKGVYFSSYLLEALDKCRECGVMQKVLFIKKKCKDSSLLSRRGSWGLFSSLYNGEPFKHKH